MKTRRCVYCGEKMVDLGKSWFCTNSDCINNKPEPKKKTKKVKEEI